MKTIILFLALFSTGALACNPESILCKPVDPCKVGVCNPYPER